VVKHLGNKGFGEQVVMLNRSLFEDMIDARWVSLNRCNEGRMTGLEPATARTTTESSTS
jgi:hypothetical protein